MARTRPAALLRFWEDLPPYSYGKLLGMDKVFGSPDPPSAFSLNNKRRR